MGLPYEHDMEVNDFLTPCRGATTFQEQVLETLRQGATQSHTVIESQQQMLQQLRDIGSLLQMNWEIPPQVFFSKPIVLLDARGISAPFHIEYIDSIEACCPKFRSSNSDITLTNDRLLLPF